MYWVNSTRNSGLGFGVTEPKNVPLAFGEPPFVDVLRETPRIECRFQAVLRIPGEVRVGSVCARSSSRKSKIRLSPTMSSPSCSHRNLTGHDSQAVHDCLTPPMASCQRRALSNFRTWSLRSGHFLGSILLRTSSRQRHSQAFAAGLRICLNMPGWFSAYHRFA